MLAESGNITIVHTAGDLLEMLTEKKFIQKLKEIPNYTTNWKKNTNWKAYRLKIYDFNYLEFLTFNLKKNLILLSV